MQRRLSRRAALGLAATAGAMTACASSRRTPEATGRVVTHRFGSTRVPAAPRRVVAIGVGDTEASISLGVVPVAGTDVLGLDDLSRPWVRAALGDATPPALLEWRELPFEEIVRLRPDLVLYVNSPGDRDVYETLSSIAPTVAAPATPSAASTFGVEWRDQLRVVGSALGRDARAEAVLASVDAELTAARRARPELSGLSVIGGLARPDQLYFWPERDPRTRLLGDLGLRASPALADLDDTGYLLSLSPERYDLLRCDVLYLAVLDREGRVPASIRRSGVLEQVEAVRRGRVVWGPGPEWYSSPTAQGDYAGALALGGPLGIPACLDRLGSDLSDAVRR